MSAVEDFGDVVQVVVTRRNEWEYRVTFHGRGEVLGEMTGDEFAVVAAVSGAVKDMREIPSP